MKLNLSWKTIFAGLTGMSAPLLDSFDESYSTHLHPHSPYKHFYTVAIVGLSVFLHKKEAAVVAFEETLKPLEKKELTKIETKIMESAQIRGLIATVLGFAGNYAVGEGFATQAQANDIQAGLLAGFDIAVALEAKKIATATTIHALPPSSPAVVTNA